jgi:hypothetical protein
MGAMPEGEVRRFADRVIAAAPAGRAARRFASKAQIAEALKVASQRPQSPATWARRRRSLAWCCRHSCPRTPLALDRPCRRLCRAQAKFDQARATLDLVPEDQRKRRRLHGRGQIRSKSAGRSGRPLRGGCARSGRSPPIRTTIQARFDLAVVRNAEGKRVEAAEALVAHVQAGPHLERGRQRARSCSNSSTPGAPRTRRRSRAGACSPPPSSPERTKRLCRSVPREPCASAGRRSRSFRSPARCCCPFRIGRSTSSSRAISTWWTSPFRRGPADRPDPARGCEPRRARAGQANRAQGGLPGPVDPFRGERRRPLFRHPRRGDAVPHASRS